MAITVIIRYSDDAMWGSQGADGYDVAASYEEFESLVTKSARELSADWEIEFERGINDVVKVICDTIDEINRDNEIKTEVESVIETVYNLGWVVKDAS